MSNPLIDKLDAETSGWSEADKTLVLMRKTPDGVERVSVGYTDLRTRILEAEAALERIQTQARNASEASAEAQVAIDALRSIEEAR